jgi:hypothetical protein
MILIRRWSEDQEAFHRKFTLCQEEWARLHATRKWPGGYRWFRSPNVTPIEYYRRPSIDVTTPNKRAG